MDIDRELLKHVSSCMIFSHIIYLFIFSYFLNFNPPSRGCNMQERLQLEALLADKSRLANEKANIMRKHQCLHQLVEYHQLKSQDLSASYNITRDVTRFIISFDKIRQ